ncbi:MAG: RDD family protein, partial [Gammaproteobacteria bacterium]
AMLYDTFLLIALWMTTLWILVPIANGPVLGAWVQSLLFIEAFVFFAFFWMRNRQTLGMQAWRIRVQNEDGSPINLRQCARRFFMAIPSLLLFGLGYWWILVDSKGRSWPDIFSASEIVLVPKPNRTAAD